MACSSINRRKIPGDGVALFAGCVEIGEQDRIDDRFERIELRRARCVFLAVLGPADPRAKRTVRQPTPCLRSISRPDNPARASRRIAAYNSTRDTIGISSSLCAAAHPTPRRQPLS